MTKKAYNEMKLARAQAKASFYMAIANEEKHTPRLREDATRAAKQFAQQIGRFLPLVEAANPKTVETGDAALAV